VRDNRFDNRADTWRLLVNLLTESRSTNRCGRVGRKRPTNCEEVRQEFARFRKKARTLSPRQLPLDVLGEHIGLDVNVVADLARAERGYAERMRYQGDTKTAPLPLWQVFYIHQR